MLQNLSRTVLAKIATFCFAVLATHSATMAMDNKVVSSDAANLKKARELIKAKNWPAAIAELRQVEKNGKANADAFNLMGFSLRKNKQYKPSFAYYQKALKLDPKHLGAHVYLGELYIQTGKIDKAVDQAKVLAKLCPSGCKESKELQRALKGAGY